MIFFLSRYSREGNKRGGLLPFSKNFPIFQISINTVENIDEVDQIIFLTTCTTKLHRYYRVTLHFLDFQQKNFFPKFVRPRVTKMSEKHELNK